MFKIFIWDIQGDVEKYRKIVEKERIYKFPLGLHKDLDEVKGIS